MPSLAKSSALIDQAQEDADLVSLDPLDPRKVALDIFEVYCHEMVTTSTVGRKAFLIEKMRVRVCVSRNVPFSIHLRG